MWLSLLGYCISILVDGSSLPADVVSTISGIPWGGDALRSDHNPSVGLDSPPGLSAILPRVQTALKIPGGRPNGAAQGESVTKLKLESTGRLFSSKSDIRNKTAGDDKQLISLCVITRHTVLWHILGLKIKKKKCNLWHEKLPTQTKKIISVWEKTSLS